MQARRELVKIIYKINKGYDIRLEGSPLIIKCQEKEEHHKAKRIYLKANIYNKGRSSEMPQGYTFQLHSVSYRHIHKVIHETPQVE